MDRSRGGGFARQLGAGGSAIPPGAARGRRRHRSSGLRLPAHDFEASLIDIFSVRQHLKFDAIEGFLLCGAAIVMRRQPSASRSILAFYGLSQLLLGLSTSQTSATVTKTASEPVLDAV